jgi:hypothetical protein
MESKRGKPTDMLPVFDPIRDDTGLKLMRNALRLAGRPGTRH